ncbi:MAG TPA: hypothetical protein VHL33_07750, partial [Casimicrobiaceae bacterium]|nr:hypothetical protein [Casimicrobiaceae bacterium]
EIGERRDDAPSHCRCARDQRERQDADDRAEIGRREIIDRRTRGDRIVEARDAIGRADRHPDEHDDPCARGGGFGGGTQDERNGPQRADAGQVGTKRQFTGAERQFTAANRTQGGPTARRIRRATRRVRG